MVYLVYSIHDYIPLRYCKMSWHWSSTNRYIREFHNHNIYLFFEIYFQRRGRIYTKGWYLFSHNCTSWSHPLGSDKWSNNFYYCCGRNWFSSVYTYIAKNMGTSRNRETASIWYECDETYSDIILTWIIQYRNSTPFYCHDLHKYHYDCIYKKKTKASVILHSRITGCEKWHERCLNDKKRGISGHKKTPPAGNWGGDSLEIRCFWCPRGRSEYISLRVWTVGSSPLENKCFFGAQERTWTSTPYGDGF